MSLHPSYPLEMSSASTSGNKGAQQATTEKKKKKDNKFKVHFGSVEVRIFRMVPGDNPSVTKGCPVQISWSPDFKETGVSLEQIEDEAVKIMAEESGSSEQQKKKLRRQEDANSRTTYPRKVFNLPAKRRAKILSENGVPAKEQMRYQKMATIARNRRKQTIENLENTAIHEKIETYWRLVTCYKEQALEYPTFTGNMCTPTTAPTAGATTTEMMFPNHHACPECVKRSLQHHKAYTQMYQCDGINHRIPEPAAPLIEEEEEEEDLRNLVKRSCIISS